MRSDPRAFLFISSALRVRGAWVPKPNRIEKACCMGRGTSQAGLPRSRLTSSRANFQRRRGGTYLPSEPCPAKAFRRWGAGLLKRVSQSLVSGYTLSIPRSAQMAPSASTTYAGSASTHDLLLLTAELHPPSQANHPGDGWPVRSRAVNSPERRRVMPRNRRRRAWMVNRRLDGP